MLVSRASAQASSVEAMPYFLASASVPRMRRAATSPCLACIAGTTGQCAFRLFRRGAATVALIAVSAADGLHRGFDDGHEPKTECRGESTPLGPACIPAKIFRPSFFPLRAER